MFEFIHRSKNHDMDQLRKAYADYERRDFDLVAQLQILQKELDGYNSDGYEHFKSVILPLEAVRLAKKRMDIPVEDTKAHNLITGQYNEVMDLMHKKEKIPFEIEVLESQRVDLLSRMIELKGRMDRQVKDAGK